MQQPGDESTITSVSDADTQRPAVASQPAHKRYHPPTLRIYGNVRDLTRTINGSTGNDAGAFPNSYTS
jgi:hypothetical protein